MKTPQSEDTGSKLPLLASMLHRLKARPDTEHEQAYARIALAVLISTYLYFSGLQDVVMLVITYQVAAIAHLLYLLIKDDISPARRITGIVADFSIVTLIIYEAGSSGPALMFTYLWIMTGAGFRFGIPYLIVAVAIGLSAELILVSTSEYWSTRTAESAGWIIASLAIPFFTGLLLKKNSEAMKEAKEASKAKSLFLANMSHELRTPLNGIVGASELLTSTQLDKKQQQYTQLIQSSGHTLLSLIEDVLDISKIEAGKQTVELIPFDIHALITTTTQLFQTQSEAKNITLSSYVSPDIPFFLKGDELHIRQVLINFISNALKFTEKGSIQLTVSKLEQSSEDLVWVHFEVIDTGIGLSKEAQENIFGSFVQADSSVTRKYGGTGLGTTISKELVELMGGQVGVKNNAGEGSIFWFDLPFQYQRKEVNTVLSKLQTRMPTIASPMRQPLPSKAPQLHILAAEDNEVNYILLREFLESMGHQVSITTDGEKTLDTLMDSQHQFDIALLDINMPKMSGLEVLETYRTVEKKKHLPIIILSADATTTNIKACLEAGADDYLTKPLEYQKLSAAINKVLPPKKDVTPVIKNTDTWQYINIETLDEICELATSDSFIKALIESFLRNTSIKITQLDQHDTKSFIGAIHALKGSASSIGAIAIQNICTTIDQQNDLTPELMHQYISELKHTFDKSQVELTQYIQSQA